MTREPTSVFQSVNFNIAVNYSWIFWRSLMSRVVFSDDRRSNGIENRLNEGKRDGWANVIGGGKDKKNR